MSRKRTLDDAFMHTPSPKKSSILDLEQIEDDDELALNELVLYDE